jgi:hypothetical protein
MPLTLLNVPAAEMRAARKAGTVDATFADLWLGTTTACFLCDTALPASANRPHTSFFNDARNPGQLVALPLCPACAALPLMVRTHRCLRVLRKMWSRPKSKPR